MPHHHAHDVAASGRRLGLSIVLTLAFVVAEAVAGYLSHSLALMSDAGHNFSDALALILSWYGLKAAERPATSRRTFGSHRVGILTALANALTLVAIGAVIMWEAVERFRDPQPVQSGPMIWVALVAVVLNGLIKYVARSSLINEISSGCPSPRRRPESRGPLEPRLRRPALERSDQRVGTDYSATPPSEA